jgi:HEAT repeat protein
MQPTSANPEMTFDAQQQQCKKEEVGAALKTALADFAADPLGSAAIFKSVQNTNGAVFSDAAMLLLTLAEPSPGVNAIARLAGRDPRVIDLLLLKDHLSLVSARAAVRHLTDAEPLFGLQMFRKVLQAFGGEARSIPAPTAMRMFYLLDQASDWSRFTPYLIQLSRHPSQHVRSKSVVLLGRGNHNMSRTREFLTSPEARMRANAVESLWGHEEISIVKLLQECSGDPHHRVAVAALVGLGRLGDLKASAQLVSLASSDDHIVRAAAAWGLGQVGRPEMAAEFTTILETLTNDPDPKVQKMARTSLERLGSPAS